MEPFNQRRRIVDLQSGRLVETTARDDGADGPAHRRLRPVRVPGRKDTALVFFYPSKVAKHDRIILRGTLKRLFC